MQKKEQKELKNSKGITLIALIITIIVMLILIGVTVTVALKEGLFSSAKQASAKTQEEKEQEQELATGRIEIDGIWYDSMDDYANNKPSKDQTDIKYKKEKEELITAAQETKGVDGKVDIAKLEEKLEGWKIEGEDQYTCTSPSGNVYKIDETGEIIETGALLTKTANAILVGDLVYIGDPETKIATVYGNKGDIDYNSEFYMSTFLQTSDEIKIASKVEINKEVYTVSVMAEGALGGPIGGNSYVRKIIIPDSITIIPDWSFCACSLLEDVTIPNSVTSIGNSAFFGCSVLKNLNIPNSVTCIGKQALSGTLWLEDQQVNSGNGLVIVNNILINATTATGDVKIPSGVTKINDDAFKFGLTGNTSITSITIPNSVTSVGSYIFGGCTSLTEIRVYWEEGNKPEGWDENWNGSSATVVYGYTGESE